MMDEGTVSDDIDRLRKENAALRRELMIAEQGYGEARLRYYYEKLYTALENIANSDCPEAARIAKAALHEHYGR